MSVAVFAHTLSVPWPISRADDSIPARALTPESQQILAARRRDVIRRRRTVLLDMPDGAGESPLVGEPVDEEPLPEEMAERADLQDVLAKAIAGLPPAYAEIVALRYAGDRSFAEIADILDCDEGTARVRFHRAKTLLRQLLRAGVDERDLK